jgi:hypothetical protein
MKGYGFGLPGKFMGALSVQSSPVGSCPWSGLTAPVAISQLIINAITGAVVFLFVIGLFEK